MTGAALYTDLPRGLPHPRDDGGCDHLIGLKIPALSLTSTLGSPVDLRFHPIRRTILCSYPKTGVPGEPLPRGWDAIAGARGCTPESSGFRDISPETGDLGIQVYGLSTQNLNHQREAANRLELPFGLLSDADLRLTRALQLPTFSVDGAIFIRRLTMIIRYGAVEHVFYSLFPPDRHANEVVQWLRIQTDVR